MKIRPAEESDQKSIREIVRAAQINPMGLDWKRFVVAEEDGIVIGVGQVKLHKDGSRELASIAVIPERQHQGIGTEIVRTLLTKEKGSVHLLCREELESYYISFGFQRTSSEKMPRDLKRMQSLANSFLLGKKIHIIGMKRE